MCNSSAKIYNAVARSNIEGACNALLSLSPEHMQRGVATHSSGNHGSALAAVAQRFGVNATIVVPRSASAFKRQAIQRYGGVIVDCGDTLDERRAKSRRSDPQ